MAKAPAKMGRPSEYSDEVAAIICRDLADGQSLRNICERDEMPSRESVRRWLIVNKDFRGRYARAREDQADALWDEAMEAARTAKDRDSAAAARCVIDAVSKLAGKLAPKVYGEKLEIEQSGSLTIADNTDRPPRETRDQWIARRARELGVDPRLLGAPAGHSD